MSIEHKKKVPYVEQMQQTECGLCCSAMILRYYKSTEPLSQLREYLDAGRDGIKISQLSNYFKHRGFETHMYKASVENLGKLPTPAIIFWNNEHFVVLEKVDKNYFSVVDPAFGRRRIKKDDFAEEYSNVILTLEPTEKFVPVKYKEHIWKPIIKNLTREKTLFLKVMVLAIVTYLISISLPIMVQYLIDEVAMNNSPHLLGRYMAIIFTIIMGYTILTLVQGSNLIKLQVTFDRFLNKSVLGKLLK